MGWKRTGRQGVALTRCSSRGRPNHARGPIQASGAARVETRRSLRHETSPSEFKSANKYALLEYCGPFVPFRRAHPTITKVSTFSYGQQEKWDELFTKLEQLSQNIHDVTAEDTADYAREERPKL